MPVQTRLINNLTQQLVVLCIILGLYGANASWRVQIILHQDDKCPSFCMCRPRIGA